MLKKAIIGLSIISAVILADFTAFAQDGAYIGFTPYSIFAIGDLQTHGSAYHKGMGGVGIATRNEKYQNYLNPASVTARDTLSFMADMSLSGSNSIFSQGDMTTAKNLFNISNIAISFPIYKSYASMMLGIQPYSSTGYEYSYILADPAIVGNTGNAVYSSIGNGSTYKAFTSAGVTFFKKLSLGLEGDFYFGNIAKSNSFTFAKSAYSTIYSGYDIVLKGASAKLGLQYEQPLGKSYKLGFGATYSLNTNLSGDVEDYEYASGSSQNDTIRYKVTDLGAMKDRICIPSELGLGISLNHSDSWRAEIDYLRSDWTGSGMDVADGFAVNGASAFTTKESESFRAGFEIIPNRNDIRYYYKRCTYRVGAYYDKSYYAVDGNQVNDIGVTLGASLPVFRLYNALTFALAVGQRSSLAGDMIRERYMKFSIGFNFHDRWFQKYHYE